MTKVQTTIVNHTQLELALRVGSQNCSAKLATIIVGGEHTIEIDVNWTYQEFSLVPTSNTGYVVRKITLNSDDCCDYERITVTKSGDVLQLDKVARGQINSSRKADLPSAHPPVPVIATCKLNVNSRPTWPKFIWSCPKFNQAQIDLVHV